ncbi:MAG: hypothetical protein ABEI80_02695 [Haloplanus sp.]
MSAIRSLRAAVDALSRAPVLFLGGLVYALVIFPQRAVQLAGVPLVPTLLQVVTFFVTPFVLAGVLGMAREALDGDTSFDAFRTVGRDRYVDLLLGTFLEFGIKLAFGVTFLVLGLLVLVTGSAAGGAGPVAILGAALVALLVIAYVVVLFLIQFYPVVIVVEGAGAVDGITESVAFVRSNVISTLGYTIITVVLGGLASLPISGFVAYRYLTSVGPSGGTAGGAPMTGGMGPGGGNVSGTPPNLDALTGGVSLGLSTPEAIALALVATATTALFFAFHQAYAVAFYRHNGRSIEERVLEDL